MGLYRFNGKKWLQYGKFNKTGIDWEDTRVTKHAIQQNLVYANIMYATNLLSILAITQNLTQDLSSFIQNAMKPIQGINRISLINYTKEIGKITENITGIELENLEEIIELFNQHGSNIDIRNPNSTFYKIPEDITSKQFLFEINFISKPEFYKYPMQSDKGVFDENGRFNQNPEYHRNKKNRTLFHYRDFLNTVYLNLEKEGKFLDFSKIFEYIQDIFNTKNGKGESYDTINRRILQKK